jgi:formylmethanofuran dehydrogenase subunit E
MPAQELFSSAEVELTVPIDTILGKPKMKATCNLCGEEIINGREVYAGEDAFAGRVRERLIIFKPGYQDEGLFQK